MSISVKGNTLRRDGKTIEAGCATHREAIAAAQKVAASGKSVGFSDTPAVEAAFESLKKGRKGDSGSKPETEATASEE